MTQSRQLPPELLAIYVPQIVQQLITDRAMAYEANRLGIRVSSDETENAILDSCRRSSSRTARWIRPR